MPNSKIDAIVSSEAHNRITLQRCPIILDSRNLHVNLLSEKYRFPNEGMHNGYYLEAS